ncbi:MAG: ABC transporter transmembrane domain-containing protein [Terrimicrobiaceae bacterium]
MDLPKDTNRKAWLAASLWVFGFLQPYRGRLSVSIATLLSANAIGLLFPYLTGVLLDAALVSRSGAAGWMTNINTVALVLLGSLAVQAGLSFVATTGFSRCGERALVDLRRKTFSRIVHLPMRFFGERRVGELTSRLTSDMAVVQDTLTGSLPQFLRQTTLMLGGIALVAFTSLELTILMVSTFPVLVLVAIGIGRRIRRHSRDGQDRLADAATVLEESLQGIANVKAFGAESFEIGRFSGFLGHYLDVASRLARLRASLISFIIFGIFGSIVAVFWHGAHLVQGGELTFGELTRFILATTFVGGSVASFADLFGHLQKSLGATERIRELLQEKPEPTEIPVSKTDQRRLKGAVDFDMVSFRYPSRPDAPVLRGLCLHCRPGQKIALVGASGAGKSTVAALLLRFYEPDSGTIRFDGLPAADYPLAALRANMAVVPQEVLLFGGTIEENIRYGRPNASREEIEAAARRSLCHDFIQGFPDGYQTIVGERGVKLSGGQRQRIAIARALLKDPAILVLDEATSSLDAESESLIQKALATLLEGRTAFIIAHRLSTVRSADLICVLEAGCVIESGTHNELMTLPGGTYRRLAEIQLAGQASSEWL